MLYPQLLRIQKDREQVLRLLVTLPKSYIYDLVYNVYLPANFEESDNKQEEEDVAVEQNNQGKYDDDYDDDYDSEDDEDNVYLHQDEELHVEALQGDDELDDDDDEIKPTGQEDVQEISVRIMKFMKDSSIR